MLQEKALAKFMKQVLLGLCLAVAAAAAGKDPAGFDALVESANGVAAEFSADALIRLAQAEEAGPARRRELLEEAFRRAAGAQQPLKRRAILAPRNGPSGFLDRAYAQELDANSLQCRAVRAMLPLDRKKARELFREIPVPQLPRLTCDDPLVYDLSLYYETLAEVVKTAFTPAEAAGDEPFKLVTDYVRGLTSPAQVAPLARLLATAPLKPAQTEALVMTFAGALKDFAGDDRSFTFSITRAGRLGPRIAELAAACAKLGIATTPLVEGYRAYLVRHLGGDRCGESADQPGISFGIKLNADEELALDPVRFFNEKLRSDPVKPIAADEIVPGKVAGAAGGLRSCESPECRNLAKLYTGLVLGPNGMPYGPDLKAGSEWQAKVKEYLAALAAWKDDPAASAAEQFQQKCLFYSDVMNLVPNSADRLAVLRSFLDFLKQNSFQRENRIEWFLPVNSLIARVSLDPVGLSDLLRDLRNSGDPVITLYTQLEERVPRPPGERLSIL